MIRVALCNYDEAESQRMRGMFKHFAETEGIPGVEVMGFETFAQFKVEYDAVRTGFYPIVVVRLDAMSDSDLAELRALSAAPEAPILIFASAVRERAVLAFEMGAFDFVLIPASYDDFTRSAGRALLELLARERPSLVVKSRAGMDNIVPTAISFVETTKNGLVIHLPFEHTVSFRSTVNALFERLSEDGRFAKAGSSFIVNLDNIRSIGEGSVIFADGEAIIVPVRARTPLKEAYADYCAGRR